jgi:uncharacterized protein YifE (UPF0438 family)
MPHPDDHAAYINRHDFVVPPGEFTPEEADLLTRYGRWMEALASGAIAPATPSQEQFVRAARGEVEPATPFELAWAKVRKERAVAAEVVDKFQALRAARARAAEVEAEYRAARQAVLATVREQLDAVDAVFAEQMQSATDEAAIAEQEVRELVLNLRRSVGIAGIKATYSAGNVSWDREKMFAYAQLHPEVLEFRKVGKPWVALKFADGPPSAQSGEQASESGESRHAEGTP